jgi:hypothetical protein
MADMAAAMADTADTADITANTPNTANILARDRREADTSSVEAGRNSAAANRENTATGAGVIGVAATGVGETGVAVIGAAVGGIMDSPVTDSSSSVHLVIRTTGVGTPLGAGAFLTRLTTAILLMDTILRIGTIMIPIAPYQESDSLGPDPSCHWRLRTFVWRQRECLN